MHHIITDGWSFTVLLRELRALYGAIQLGRPAPLPELTVQYADYAAWLRQWLQGEALETLARQYVLANNVVERLSNWMDVDGLRAVLDGLGPEA